MSKSESIRCVGSKRAYSASAFAGAYRAYAFEEFAEVVVAEDGCALLEAVVVHDEAFADVFVEYACGPLPEVRGAAAVDTVAYAYYCIKGTDRLLTFYLPCPFLLNY